MPNHYKVHELLSASELEEFEAFAREPGRTVDELHEWLQARGFTMSRSSVGRWKGDFDGRVLQERMTRSGELARAIKGAVSGGEFSDVADAAVMQLTQVVFEQAARLEAEGEIDPLNVQRMTRSLANLTGTKERLTAMLAAKFDAEMKSKVERKKGAITPDDIAEARKAIFGV